jgi:hypothetical protein
MLGFSILIILFTFVNSDTDHITKTCTLIDSAKVIKSNTCFEKVKYIIACFTPCEQDLWVKAFIENKDESRCFDCSAISEDAFKSCRLEFTNNITNKASFTHYQIRKSLYCLKSFSNDILDDYDTSLLNDFVRTQYDIGYCYKTFVKNLININTRRRRFLCANNIIRDQNAMNTDSSGKITQFKFTVNEANVVVGSFNMFMDCSAQLTSSLINTVNSFIRDTAVSQECVKTRSLLSDSGLLSLSELSSYNIESASKNIMLGGDVNIYFSKLMNDAKDFPELVSSINNAQDLVITQGVVCDPLISKLFSNIQQKENTQKSTVKMIYNFIKDTTCDSTNYTYSIKNKQINCTGKCPNSFVGFSFNWISEYKAFSFYEIWAGCINGAKFFLSNITNNNNPVIQYIYKTKEIDFDLSIRCKQRALTCIPGINREINIDGACQQDTMDNTCSKYLDQKCSATGLQNILIKLINTSSNNLPEVCQAVDASLSLSASFNLNYNLTVALQPNQDVANCLTFIDYNLLNGLSIYSNNMINIESLLNIKNPNNFNITQIFTNNQYVDNSEYLNTYITENDFEMDTDIKTALRQINSEDLSDKYLKGNLFLILIIFIFN